MQLYALFFVVGFVSATIPRAPVSSGKCCFALVAEGAPAGPSLVEEDTIGENRIFSTYPDGAYCIDPAQPGKLFDSLDKTCIIYKSSGQLQCTQGIPSDTVFTIDDEGDFLANGNNTFFACPAGGPDNNDGSLNIFGAQKLDTSLCIPITLMAIGSGCTPSSNTTASTTLPPVMTFASSTSVSSSTSISSFINDDSMTIMTQTSIPSSIGARYRNSTRKFLAPSLTAENTFKTSALSPTPARLSSTPGVAPTYAASACPTDLSGKFLPPNLIIPVSSEDPTVALGTQNSATITPFNSTLFSFDIPQSYTGRCSLIFTFPYGNFASIPYEFSGVEEEVLADGGLDFALLNGHIANSVTYETKPDIAMDYGTIDIVPGNNYAIANFECQTGQRITYEVSSVNNLTLQYFQSSGDSPLGLWIVKC